jgi:RNA polymerase sigma factor (sigma-70 family)
MSIVHPFPPDEPASFACAQAGCQACLDALMRQHQGLIHVVLRRQARGGVSYDDLLQEGRIALWQAILHFEPHRGPAFSTYAGAAIRHQIWRAVKLANRPQGWLPAPVAVNPLEMAEEHLWQDEVHAALLEAVSRLPERLRQVITAAYGLDGEPPCTLVAIGRCFGVTKEMARYWRDQGLVLLRLPAFSGRLCHLCDQDSRAAYLRMQSLNRVWLRKRRPSRRRGGRKQR